MESHSRTGRDLCSLLALMLSGLALFGVLRLWLTLCQRTALADLPPLDLLEIFWVGAQIDASVMGYLLIPGALLLLLPEGARHASVTGYTRTLLVLLAIEIVAEGYFFAFYGFRPSYPVLEYGLRAEVRGDVAVEYASLMSVVFLSMSTLGSWCLFRGFRGLLAPVGAAAGRGRRRWVAAASLVAVLGLAVRGASDHRPLDPDFAVRTPDRIANEISGSGLYNVGYEAVRLGASLGS